MAESQTSGLSSRMARLNPFKQTTREDDDEDKGEEIDSTTVAGGGHSAPLKDPIRHELRVSDALRTFLAAKGVVDDDVQTLVEKSHLAIPQWVTDTSYTLPEYFISSSHNTYLMAHQLYGQSSAGAYQTTLNAGARCIEIDAWDNPDDRAEPKVTHGYTLVSNIPFRLVCETIRDVVDQEAAQSMPAAPILLSLENHCDAGGQLRLAQIMREVWGARLLAEPVRGEGLEQHVTLAELGSKILVIVEHHLPDEEDNTSDSSSSSSSEDEGEKQARHDYKDKKKTDPGKIIVPELAALGIYAQSVKPRDGSWFGATGLTDSPHHPLINVSEAGLASHLPTNAAAIARHNARHLMRVFPKGTRISSRNLRPEVFWGLGAQICALNWQTFGAGMQLNDALFAGTPGFALKPAALRSGGDGDISGGRRTTLRLHVVGATDVPVPGGRSPGEIKPYLTCSLVHPAGTTKKKTSAVRRKNEDEQVVSPVWDEMLEWEFNDNELVFLRLLIKSDDSFSSNPVLAVAAVRLLYVAPGWVFLPMLDLRGHRTKCSVLVKFEVQV